MSRKLKVHVIYDNYDIYSKELAEEAKESIIENEFFNEDENGRITVTDNYGKEVTVTREEYAKTVTEERIEAELRFWDDCNFRDSKDILEEVTEGYGLIAIADLGRWNGRFSGYKEIKQLVTVLHTSCDYQKVYVDSNGDLRKEETHHDGSNSILYRYWKDGLTQEQKDNFMDKIYNGKCTQRDITRYTRKAGIAIANYYGWTVRGGENKYRNVA